MKHYFIVNPISGKEDAGQSMVPQILHAASTAKISYEIELTRTPGHATELARQAAAKGEEIRLYAVGGDGTLNEVFEGAYPFKNAEVASIPCGSGNDFVRNFGTAEEFLNFENQFAGQAITIDLMQANNRIAAAIASMGLDAEVAYNIPKYRRLPFLGGTMAYNISILEKLLSPIGEDLSITIDGTTFTGKFLIATVCNGKTYGGGFCAAPIAKLDDGILEVILVKKVSRLRIASIIGKYKAGTHFINGRIDPKLADVILYYRGKEVDIRPLSGKNVVQNIDGECGPSPGLRIKVMPDAARFVLPKGMVYGG